MLPSVHPRLHLHFHGVWYLSVADYKPRLSEWIVWLLQGPDIK